MLDDFYSDFFPAPLGAQGLRASCRSSANPPPRAEQPERSRSSAAEETLVRVASGPGEPSKRPRLAAPGARRSASLGSGRAPRPELLVPDSDYMEEAEDDESQWQHCRRPGRGGEPPSRGGPGAGLGHVAGAGTARLPLPWPEGGETSGGCRRSASPRLLADLEDQVVTDCWLPEE